MDKLLPSAKALFTQKIKELLRAGDSNVFAIGLSCKIGHEKSYAIEQSVYDALGVSESSIINKKELQISRGFNSAPQISLAGSLKTLSENRQINQWFVSLADDEDSVIAVAVGTKSGCPIKGIGIDLTFRERFQQITHNKEHSTAFIQELLAPEETKLINSSSSIDLDLARIWAVKEAVFKALPYPKPHFLNYRKNILISGSTKKPSVHLISSESSKPLKYQTTAMVMEQDSIVIAFAALMGTSDYPADPGFLHEKKP